METSVIDFMQKIQSCLDIAHTFDDIRRETLSAFWCDVADQFDRIFKRNYLSETFNKNTEDDFSSTNETNKEFKSNECGDQGVNIFGTSGNGNLKANKLLTPNKRANKRKPDLRKSSSKKKPRLKNPNLEVEKHNDDCGITRTGFMEIKEDGQPRRSSRKSKPSKVYSDDYITPNTALSMSETNAINLKANARNVELTESEDTLCLDGADPLDYPETPMDLLKEKIVFKSLNSGDGDLTVSDPQISHVVKVQMSRNNRDIEVYVTTDHQSRTNESIQEQSPEKIINPTPTDHVYFSLPDATPETMMALKNDPEINESENYAVLSENEKEREEPDVNDSSAVVDAELANPGEPQEEESSGEDGKQQSPRKETNKKPPRRTWKKGKDGLYQCPECDKKVANSSNLKVHLRTHSGEKPFKCTECGQSFTTLTNMTRHVRTRHDKERRWQCEQCHKWFSEKKSLVVHQRIHSGERPFECNVCHQRFAQSGTLKSHMHCHTGFKGHLCDFCGKSFRQKSQMYIHQLRHDNIRNFKCPVCPKAFVSKEELSRHEVSHTGARPYLCSYCPKTFTRLQYLRQHLLLHSEQLLCKNCGQNFNDQVSRANHTCEQPFSLSGESSSAQQPTESESFGETYIVLPPTSTLLLPEYEQLGSEVVQLPTMVAEENANQVETSVTPQTPTVLDKYHIELTTEDSQTSEAAGGVNSVVSDSTTSVATHNTVTVSVPEHHLVNITHLSDLGKKGEGLPCEVDSPAGGNVPLHVQAINQEVDSLTDLGTHYIVLNPQEVIGEEEVG